MRRTVWFRNVRTLPGMAGCGEAAHVPIHFAFAEPIVAIAERRSTKRHFIAALSVAQAISPAQAGLPAPHRASLLAILFVDLLPRAGAVLKLERVRDLAVALAREHVASLRRHRAHVTRSGPHELIAVPSGRFFRGIAAHVVEGTGDQRFLPFVIS